MDRNERVEEIRERIYDAIPDNVTANEIFEALVWMIEYGMTTICPTCRADMAAELSQRVPQMLADANAFAAEHPDMCPNTPCQSHH